MSTRTSHRFGFAALLMALSISPTSAQNFPEDRPWKDVDDALLKSAVERQIVPEVYRTLELDSDLLLEILATGSPTPAPDRSPYRIPPSPRPGSKSVVRTTSSSIFPTSISASASRRSRSTRLRTDRPSSRAPASISPARPATPKTAPSPPPWPGPLRSTAPSAAVRRFPFRA